MQKIHKLYLIIAIIAIISVLSLSIYFFYDSKNDQSIVENVPTQDQKNFYVDLNPMIIELRTPVGYDKKEYLRMNLTLLISSTSSNEMDAKKEKIISNMPAIDDVILVFFSSLTVLDLQEKRNFFFLKEELLNRINKVINPEIVEEVLFKEFITGS